MIVAFDIDGVLADTKGEGIDAYADALPRPEAIALIKEFRDAGDVVILWTGRRESRRRITEDWLDLNGVDYDFLFMGKPRFDFFIDDKARTLEQVLEDGGLDGGVPRVRKEDHLGDRFDGAEDPARPVSARVRGTGGGRNRLGRPDEDGDGESLCNLPESESLLRLKKEAIEIVSEPTLCFSTILTLRDLASLRSVGYIKDWSKFPLHSVWEVYDEQTERNSFVGFEAPGDSDTLWTTPQTKKRPRLVWHVNPLIQNVIDPDRRARPL